MLAPVIVSASMIAAGMWHLRREAIGERMQLSILQWVGIVLGAFVIVTSFTLDHRNIMVWWDAASVQLGDFRLWYGDRCP